MLVPPTIGSAPPPRTTADATLSVVEIYPYVPYIQYLLPGTIVAGDFCFGHDWRRHHFH